MNEGLRPYWYNSSISKDRIQFRLMFYYPADIDSITILDKITGIESILNVEQKGKYLYVRTERRFGVNRIGYFNNGNTVIYDQRQENPVYSNRISKR